MAEFALALSDDLAPYRLVFSSPEEAGRRLVDYRDRLGARVEYSQAEEWFPSFGTAEAVARNLDVGRRYRIVGSAPATPEAPERPAGDVIAVPRAVLERLVRAWAQNADVAAAKDEVRALLDAAPAAEPRETPDDEPEPSRRERHRERLIERSGDLARTLDHRLASEHWVLVGQEQWGEAKGIERAREALAECVDSMTTARPSLPEATEDIAWSPRYGCWVLNSQDVPRTWQESLVGQTWFAAGTYHPGLLVLARPVPVPEPPKTERVPWWEAASRKASDPESTEVGWVEVGAGDDDDPRPWARGHGTLCAWPIPIAEDGTVEVLRREAP